MASENSQKFIAKNRATGFRLNRILNSWERQKGQFALGHGGDGGLFEEVCGTAQGRGPQDGGRRPKLTA